MSSVWRKIGMGGRLVIPAEHRKALGLKPGDDVLVRLQEGELRIVTLQQALTQAQALVRQYVPQGRSLVDEVIEDRRREAARE